MAKKLLCLLIAVLTVFTLSACDVATRLPAETDAPAKDGKDGITPHIGDNGNWFIGDEDTGISAQGPKGEQGEAGKDGENGKDGANGTNGTDGVTPHIGDNGNWFIGDRDTGIPAQGHKGEQGEAGKDGENGKDGNGILRLEIIDGYLWVTYTKSPDTPVNIGKIVESNPATEGLEFYPLSDGTYGVMAGNAIHLDKIVIPATYNDRAVTQILANGFQNAFNLVSITIPSTVTFIDQTAFHGCGALEEIVVEEGNLSYRSTNNCLIEINTKKLIRGCNTGIIPTDTGVTTIGTGAFSGSTLTEIVIPANIIKIEELAFADCTKLQSITIPFTGASASATGESGKLSYLFGGSVPSSLKTVTLTAGTAVKAGAFASCGVKTVNLPDTVKEIGSEAFSGCYNLTTIALPSTLTEIGPYAFSDCVDLETLDIPDSVTEIGTMAFDYCPKLLTYYQYGVYVDNWLVASDETADSITIRPGTVGIAALSFKERVYITTLTIPEGVKHIGASAFYLCTGITSISLPSTLVGIGDFAFSCCTSLQSITVAAGNSVYSASGNCLIERSSQTLILGCKASVIPADGSVTTIGKWAFYKCKTLTHIEIPDGVKKIEINAFNDCMGLASIVLPASLTTIGTGAFQSCNALATGTVYYDGTAEQWAAIAKNDNVYLASATVYYYSSTQPASTGKYWHYVNDIPTKW